MPDYDSSAERLAEITERLKHTDGLVLEYIDRKAHPAAVVEMAKQMVDDAIESIVATFSGDTEAMKHLMAITWVGGFVTGILYEEERRATEAG